MQKSDPKYGIPEGALESILSLCKEFPEINRVVLFGSRAIGTYQNGSDIDLALSGNHLNIETKLKLLVAYRRLNLPWELDLVLDSPELSKDLKTHILTEGIELYKKSI